MITLCVLLWAKPGHDAELIAYEDQVLSLLPDHGAKVLSRVRNVACGDNEPLEVHVLTFPSRDALDAYLADDRRTALAQLRDRAVAATQLLDVEAV